MELHLPYACDSRVTKVNANDALPLRRDLAKVLSPYDR